MILRISKRAYLGRAKPLLNKSTWSRQGLSGTYGNKNL